MNSWNAVVSPGIEVIVTDQTYNNWSATIIECQKHEQHVPWPHQRISAAETPWNIQTGHSSPAFSCIFYYVHSLVAQQNPTWDDSWLKSLNESFSNVFLDLLSQSALEQHVVALCHLDSLLNTIQTCLKSRQLLEFEEMLWSVTC